MFSLIGLKAKLAAGGVILLAVIGMIVKLKVVEYQLEKSKVKAETLKAQLVQHKVQKKIFKEQKEKLDVGEAEIVVQLEKEDEEFTGIDSLTNPNDRD